MPVSVENSYSSITVQLLLEHELEPLPLFKLFPHLRLDFRLARSQKHLTNELKYNARYEFIVEAGWEYYEDELVTSYDH